MEKEEEVIDPKKEEFKKLLQKPENTKVKNFKDDSFFNTKAPQTRRYVSKMEHINYNKKNYLSARQVKTQAKHIINEPKNFETQNVQFSPNIYTNRNPKRYTIATTLNKFPPKKTYNKRLPQPKIKKISLPYKTDKASNTNSNYQSLKNEQKSKNFHFGSPVMTNKYQQQRSEPTSVKVVAKQGNLGLTNLLYRDKGRGYNGPD